MLLEVIIAVQIFLMILYGTHVTLVQKKKIKEERQAEVRRMNYMADSSSSMEEGFDIDFDRRQKVWQNKHTTRIVNSSYN